MTQGVLKRKLPTPPGGPGARRTAMDVYDALRDAILGGEIKSGSLLTQVDIARDFGVSRTPVREALRRLQESGLVAGAPNYRSRVVGFDAEEDEALGRVVTKSGITVVPSPDSNGKPVRIFEKQ